VSSNLFSVDRPSHCWNYNELMVKRDPRRGANAGTGLGEATLPPGVKEHMHSHPASVIYVLEGGRYRNYAADGKITEGEMETGEVIYRDPITHYARCGTSMGVRRR
jgi:uncharacterized RmlC-like cupin family protein